MDRKKITVPNETFFKKNIKKLGIDPDEIKLPKEYYPDTYASRFRFTMDVLHGSAPYHLNGTPKTTRSTKTSQGKKRATELAGDEARVYELWKDSFLIDPSTDCNVWIRRKQKTPEQIDLANGHPRFGPGQLVIPTSYARHFAYYLRYGETPPPGRRIKMQRTCHRLCVNPNHIVNPCPENQSH